MDGNDLKQVQDMIQGSIVAAFAAQKQVREKTSAEVGSPEFAEDRTQINSLNNKGLFAEERAMFGRMFYANLQHSRDLDSRSLQSLDNLLALQEKVNLKFFTGTDDRARLRDLTFYETVYDLGNPVTTGTGDAVRAAAYTPNRAVDTATAQSTLNNTTMQTAIEAAVANALNGTIPTLEAAIGAAVAAALANVPVKTAA